MFLWRILLIIFKVMILSDMQLSTKMLYISTLLKVTMMYRGLRWWITTTINLEKTRVVVSNPHVLISQFWSF